MTKKKPAGFAYMKKHDTERFKEVTSKGGRSAQKPKGFAKTGDASEMAKRRWKKYKEEKQNASQTGEGEEG